MKEDKMADKEKKPPPPPPPPPPRNVRGSFNKKSPVKRPVTPKVPTPTKKK
jgi:hypothetical protein